MTFIEISQSCKQTLTCVISSPGLLAWQRRLSSAAIQWEARHTAGLWSSCSSDGLCLKTFQNVCLWTCQNTGATASDFLQRRFKKIGCLSNYSTLQPFLKIFSLFQFVNNWYSNVNWCLKICTNITHKCFKFEFPIVFNSVPFVAALLVMMVFSFLSRNTAVEIIN